MQFFKRASSSLWGHVILCELFFSLPLFLIFLEANYTDGTLNFAWALYLAAVWSSLGAVGAAFIWYTISLPLIRKRDGRSQARNDRQY